MLEEETDQAGREAYSSHLNDHRKETFPTSLSSTMIDGLKSSRVLSRLTGFGEAHLINNDPEIGSVKVEGQQSPYSVGETWMGGLTVDVDLVCCALNQMLAVMHDSRGINEVNYVWVVGARGKLQGE